RVALHDVRRAGVVRPAIPFAIVRGRLIEERLCDVAGERGVEQRHELQLRAIHVPTGEVRVLRMLAARDGVRLVIEAAILAVEVAEEVRVQQRVVERRVEDGALLYSAAADLHATERLRPRGPRTNSQRG